MYTCEDIGGVKKQPSTQNYHNLFFSCFFSKAV